MSKIESILPGLWDIYNKVSTRAQFMARAQSIYNTYSAADLATAYAAIDYTYGAMAPDMTDGN
jgi:hypothetical protein